MGSNHLDLLNDLNSKKNEFDSIHFDFTDNYYCEALGLSVVTLEQLAESTSYNIDVHMLLKNTSELTRRIEKLNIRNINYHIESLDAEDFKSINVKNTDLGVAIKLETNLALLEDYLESAKSIILLCITPSLFPYEVQSNPIKRVTEFRKKFPSFRGRLIVDGGVTEKDFSELEELGVDTVVVGKTYFN